MMCYPVGTFVRCNTVIWEDIGLIKGQIYQTSECPSHYWNERDQWCWIMAPDDHNVEGYRSSYFTVAEEPALLLEPSISLDDLERAQDLLGELGGKVV